MGWYAHARDYPSNLIARASARHRKEARALRQQMFTSQSAVMACNPMWSGSVRERRVWFASVN
jgi:hypothetical protein